MTFKQLFDAAYSRGWITARDGNACILDLNTKNYCITRSGFDRSAFNANTDLLYGRLEHGLGFLLPHMSSIESEAHIGILNMLNKTHSVHLHAPNTTALFSFKDSDTIEQELIHDWPEVFRYTKIGPTINVLRPGSDELQMAICEAFSEGADFIVLKNHGVFAVGNSFKECFEHIERVEHIAYMFLMGRKYG